MTRRKSDLHGAAPDHARLALLIVDLISDFRFEDGERMSRLTLPIAHRVRALKARAKAARVPSIYVNDNFGRWRSDFRQLVEHCATSDRGAEIAKLLMPEPDDYFVLKPKQSGFYSTTLDILLKYIGAERVIITGIASDQCVLFTASDAYLRDIGVTIPTDCIAASTKLRTNLALRYFKTVLKADVRQSSRVVFPRVKRR
jgi:nicotinamidase-related amidase